MTERAQPVEPIVGRPAPGGRSQRRGVPARRGHPLLRPFPLAIMTVATFLVVFTLMMARLTAGADPALRASVTAGAISRPVGSGASTVVTRASGAGATVAAVSHGARGEGPPTAATIVTRTSRAAGSPGVGDD
jgi:hypothetical protein